MRVSQVLGLALLLPLVLLGAGCRKVDDATAARVKPVTLEYWRVFDEDDGFTPAIAAYRQTHPHVRINYRVFRFDEYEKALLTALAEDRGPDILSLHNTWMGKWEPRLVPMPDRITVGTSVVKQGLKKEVVSSLVTRTGMTPKQVSEVFVPVVEGDVTFPVDGPTPTSPRVRKVFGLPLSVDTLALYSNRALLNNAGIPAPARTWKEFQEQAKKITRLDQAGTIVRSAAAIGTATNVERSADILSALMIQNDVAMTDAAGVATFDRYPTSDVSRPLPPGAEALVFYTDFANPTKEVYSWNDRFPNSLEAFAKGQTAYFLGYSYHQAQIRQLNPTINMAVSPLPQVDPDNPKTIANYWVEAVSKKSAHPEEAWDFLLFLTDKDHVGTYLSTTRKPAALKALLPAQQLDNDLSVFASQGPLAKSWYHGNDAAAMETAFADMVAQALADDADIKKIVSLGATKVNQTVR
jgi:ABC-type glycerol-3-phosphate transport system substrate-binding protein